MQGHLRGQKRSGHQSKQATERLFPLLPLDGRSSISSCSIENGCSAAERFTPATHPTPGTRGDQQEERSNCSQKTFETVASELVKESRSNLSNTGDDNHNERQRAKQTGECSADDCNKVAPRGNNKLPGLTAASGPHKEKTLAGAEPVQIKITIGPATCSRESRAFRKFGQ